MTIFLLRLAIPLLLLAMAGCGGKNVRDIDPETAGDSPTLVVAQTSSVNPDDLYDLLVAEMAGRNGQMDLAVQKYLEVGRRTRDAKVVERGAQFAWFAQLMPQAIESAELWVDVAPTDANALRHAALVNFRGGRIDAAVPYFDRFIALSGNRLDETGNSVFMGVAEQLAAEENDAGAEQVLNALIDHHPSSVEALLAKAQFALRKSRYDVALSATAQALARAPRMKEAVVMRARALALGESKEAALKYLEGVIAGPLGESSDIRMGYARLLLDAGRLEDARAQFDTITNLEPGNLDARFAAGLLALQGGDLAGAEVYLTHTLEAGHRPVECHYYLGQIAEITQRPQLAIEHFTQVDRGEFYFDAQVRVAALLAKLDQLDQAREYLHEIATQNAQQGLQIYLIEGELLRNAGLYQEADDLYDRALVAMPESHDLLYARALNAERLDDLDKAESDLRAIVNADPKNAQALNALGYTLADRTSRYAEALELIRRALDLQPDEPAILDSMGWVHYRLGNYEEAVKYLRRAIDLGADPEIAAHLGEVLWVKGDHTAARDVWQKALEKQPSHEILQRTMKQFGL